MAKYFLLFATVVFLAAPLIGGEREGIDIEIFKKITALWGAVWVAGLASAFVAWMIDE